MFGEHTVDVVNKEKCVLGLVVELVMRLNFYVDFFYLRSLRVVAPLIVEAPRPCRLKLRALSVQHHTPESRRISEVMIHCLYDWGYEGKFTQDAFLCSV